MRVHDYGMAARAQDARLETIIDDSMAPIMKRFLKTFKENKGDYPENIIVYRDGVSESQFAMVICAVLRYSMVSHGLVIILYI